jgi:hypothetical protein
LNIISEAVWTPPFEVTAGFRLPGSELMATTSVPPLVGSATVVCVVCVVPWASGVSSSLAHALATSAMAKAATVRCFFNSVPPEVSLQGVSIRTTE